MQENNQNLFNQIESLESINNKRLMDFMEAKKLQKEEEQRQLAYYIAEANAKKNKKSRIKKIIISFISIILSITLYCVGKYFINNDILEVIFQFFPTILAFMIFVFSD